jgi:putative CocE/NonD family hydrolase
MSGSGGDSSPADFDVREHYTKYEFRVPMRDGVRLFTAALVPKDASRAFPFMLDRTPFDLGPYGPDEYVSASLQTQGFLKAGYIWVRQDVRGRGLSEGEFTHVTPHRADKKTASDVDESTDTYDTVEWLLEHIPNHNGRVGIWGVSYDGFFTIAGIIDTHPAIKAASPQAPVADLFLGDDWYHNGAFQLAKNFEGATSFRPEAGAPPRATVPFDYGTSDCYEFFINLGTLADVSARLPGPNAMWDETVAHPSYDSYWQSRAIWRHLKNIRCAVLTVGGWFDAEDLMGPLRVYQAIGDNNPGVSNSLVMGPWVHGGWARHDGRRLGNVDFATDTARYYRENVITPFFEFHLKDTGELPPSEAIVFETGTNVWRRYPAWPPPAATPRILYFRHDGGLSFESPTEVDAGDAWVSDPTKAVPVVGYTTPTIPDEYMVSDQRFASTRPDVLTYVTEPLDEDVTLAGPVTPRLFVSTTGTDSDWVVKLIDVYPPDRSDGADTGPDHGNDVGPPPAASVAGYQQLVRGWPLRGKFRNSFEQPEPFEPGIVEAVSFTMPDINHVFRRGHRIMLQVQSTWFPVMDRNPQTFVDIPTATRDDYQPATQQLIRSRTQPSGVEVHVLQQ